MKKLSIEKMEGIEGGSADCLHLFQEWSEADENSIEYFSNNDPVNGLYWAGMANIYSQDMMANHC